MTTATAVKEKEFIIIGYNNLSYSCETRMGDEYWPYYQLGHFENGEGCLYSELTAREVDPSDEQIIVSTPGIDVPEWCGECKVEWQVLDISDDDDPEYLEVALIDYTDEASLQAWYRWYDSGFSDEKPEN